MPSITTSSEKKETVAVEQTPVNPVLKLANQIFIAVIGNYITIPTMKGY